MAKIISAYRSDESLGSSLKGLFDSFMSNTPQTELARQKARGLIRENENLPLAADSAVSGDVAGMTRHGLLAGLDPKNIGGYNQFRVVNQYGPADPRSTTATMAVPGSNFGNTVQGERESQRNRVNIENLRTQRLFDAERYKTDNTPQMVLDPTTRQPIVGRRSESFGLTPVLNHSDAQGTILQQDAPTMTPEQRAAAGGYAPKNPANLWVGRTADGALTTTADGRTSIQTGAPIVGPVQKMEGANTEGLSGDSSVNQKLLESRVATQQFAAGIDGLIAGLSSPNADQASGYLGTAARTLNDLRSQAEATVRLFGGESAAQAFTSKENGALVDSAVVTLMRDPGIVAKMQHLGIDSNNLRSQIQDLAYAMAKAQDPGGRIGVDDIRRATETIGGAIMDPKVAVPVLTKLKQRILNNQTIREGETRKMYPRVGAPQGAPAGVQPNDPLGIR